MCRMACSQFKKQLWDYAEGTLSKAHTLKLEEHLGHCSACSGELAFLIEVDDALETYPFAVPPADLLSSVIAESHTLPQSHIRFVIGVVELFLAGVIATAISFLVWVTLVPTLAAEGEEIMWMEDLLDSVFGLTLAEAGQLALQVLPWSAMAVGCTLALYLAAGIYNNRHHRRSTAH